VYYVYIEYYGSSCPYCGGAQWKNVGLWPADFPWPAPDLQLMGNHLYS